MAKMNMKMLSGSVKTGDVLMGAVAGAVGGGTAQAIWPKIPVLSSLPIGAKFMPLAGSALVSALLWFVPGNKSRRMGHVTGALAVGSALTVRNFLVEYVPQLSDVVALRMQGLLVDDPARMAAYHGMGLLTQDTQQRALQGYADKPGLAGLAQMSMLTDDDDGGDNLFGMN